MAIFSIKSDNPSFSHIIKKNPASPMLIKSIRDGKCFGWFNGTQQYNLYFKDSDIKVSYKSHIDEEFEYNNRSRYNSAMFPINGITDFLASASKSLDGLDTAVYQNSALINLIYIRSPKYIDYFAQHFKDFILNHKEVAPHNFNIEVWTKKPLYHLLQYINLFCLINVLNNDEDNLFITKEFIDKFIKIPNLLDAPYYIRYLLKTKLFTAKEQFVLYRDKLETDSIKLTYGYHGMSRMFSVLENLDKSNSVLDIGCGEGSYIKRILQKLPDNKAYYAIDRDLDTVEHLKKKFDDNDRIIIGQNLSEVEEDNLSIILIEVIEHQDTIEEAKELVRAALSKNPAQLIITTPNKDFNQFYFESEELRHTDHKFELSYTEFEDLINEVIPPNYTSRYIKIGDSVQTIFSTSGVVITRKD